MTYPYLGACELRAGQPVYSRLYVTNRYLGESALRAGRCDEHCARSGALAARRSQHQGQRTFRKRRSLTDVQFVQQIQINSSCIRDKTSALYKNNNNSRWTRCHSNWIAGKLMILNIYIWERISRYSSGYRISGLSSIVAVAIASNKVENIRTAVS